MGITQERKRNVARILWRGSAQLVLLVVCAQAGATHTMCDFEASGGGRDYGFEFIGGDSVAMIQVNAPRGARLGAYEITTLDQRTQRIRMIHTASASADTLPSFVLEGTGEHVWLRFADHAIPGVLRCQVAYDG